MVTDANREPSVISDALAALARLSARIGRDIMLVQGAGGNTSIKLDRTLWVKASGTCLSDAERQEIFTSVGLDAARAAIAAGSERLETITAAPTAPALRPSIETSLHALLPHRVVVHVHSVNVLARAVQANAETALRGALDGIAWAWLPYRRPGLPLTRAVAEIAADRRPDAIVLGNHGLVVGADDCDGAAALLSEIERRLFVPPRATATADLGRLAALSDGSPYRPADDEESHQAATEPMHAKFAAGGSLYPDHVVFLGPGAFVLDGGDSPRRIADRCVARGAAPPAFMLIPGAGTLVRRDLGSNGRAMLRCLGLVLPRLPVDADIVYLTPDHERALLDWDAEKYRASIAR